LVSLRECVPVLDVVVDVLVATNERLLFVHTDYLDHLDPLISNIAFLILLDDGRLNMVKVVDAVG
jgi:hypothetical protein